MPIEDQKSEMLPTGTKVLPEALAADAERLTRFQREADVLALAAHVCEFAAVDVARLDNQQSPIRNQQRITNQRSQISSDYARSAAVQALHVRRPAFEHRSLIDIALVGDLTAIDRRRMVEDEQALRRH